MADAAELPVSEAADSGGGVYFLPHALWWKRALTDLSGPDQLCGEERDPLLLPEEPESAQRRRPAAPTGTAVQNPKQKHMMDWNKIDVFKYLWNRVINKNGQKYEQHFGIKGILLLFCFYLCKCTVIAMSESLDKPLVFAFALLRPKS